MIADYNLEQDLDICCLTETWLNADDPVTIGELCPNGYKLISIPSKDRCGGGVAVVVKEPLSVKQNCPDDVAFHSFEHLTTIITHPQHSQPFNLCIVFGLRDLTKIPHRLMPVLWTVTSSPTEGLL